MRWRGEGLAEYLVQQTHDFDNVQRPVLDTVNVNKGNTTEYAENIFVKRGERQLLFYQEGKDLFHLAHLHSPLSDHRQREGGDEVQKPQRNEKFHKEAMMLTQKVTSPQTAGLTLGTVEMNSSRM